MRGAWIFYLLTVLLLGIGVAIPFFCDDLRGILWLEGGVVLSLLGLWRLYVNIVKPVRSVLAGMDLLREQDFASRLAPVGQHDADKIVTLFNDLMARLKAERMKVREQNHFLDLLIEASPLGIMSYGFSDKIVMCNSMARKLLGEDPAGKRLQDLKSPLAKAFMQLRRDESVTVRLGDAMVYRCSHLSFMDQGYARPFLLIETLTDEVRMAERQAYEKVIRVMGHEVNNSMASIRSLLEILQEIRPWGDDEELSAAVAGCVHRAEALSSFISSYSKVVKIPPLNISHLTIDEFFAPIEHFLEGMARNRGVNLVAERCDAPDAYAKVSVDTELMEQVMINVVKNSVESILSCDDHSDREIKVALCAPSTIVVTDSGAGLSPQAAESIFTPFFSTKPSGQGLGLMFVSEILSRHKATYSLVTSPDDGLTRFTVTFPPIR